MQLEIEIVITFTIRDDTRNLFLNVSSGIILDTQKKKNRKNMISFSAKT